MDQTIAVLQGDAREVLAALPADSVHVCCTSPPYFQKRDYHHADQIGMEETPDAFVEALVGVFRAVRRVLHPSGTLWVVMGDGWNAAGRKGHGTRIGGLQRSTPASAAGDDWPRSTAPGLKRKDLIGVPWMLAFALRADGWYLRSEIVWQKRCGLPESVKDRVTYDHETVFMLAKSEHYFFDWRAIREPPSPYTRGGGSAPYTADGRTTQGLKSRSLHQMAPDGRRKRSVWPIAPEPSTEEHYAAFPQKLVEHMIKAGTSEAGCCPECRAPWRHIEPEKSQLAGEKRLQQHERPAANAMGVSASSLLRSNGRTWRAEEDLGWEAGCRCDAGDPIPCTVLDPFLGTGTTAVVAKRLRCSAIGIELNEDYCRIARRRIDGVSLPLPMPPAPTPPPRPVQASLLDSDED